MYSSCLVYLCRWLWAAGYCAVAQDVHCTMLGADSHCCPWVWCCWARVPYDCTAVFSQPCACSMVVEISVPFSYCSTVPGEFQDPSCSQIHHHSRIPVTACSLEDAPVTSTHIPCQNSVIQPCFAVRETGNYLYAQCQVVTQGSITIKVETILGDNQKSLLQTRMLPFILSRAFLFL